MEFPEGTEKSLVEHGTLVVRKKVHFDRYLEHPSLKVFRYLFASPESLAVFFSRANHSRRPVLRSYSYPLDIHTGIIVMVGEFEMLHNAVGIAEEAFERSVGGYA